MSRSYSGRIITFYSYKGGTGRSMALANVAWILASQGKRVLAVDWHLEAPGLHRYFKPFLVDKELISSEGLIDFIVDFAIEAMTPVVTDEAVSQRWYTRAADITPYTLSLDWNFPNDGTLDFVPAGRQGHSYSQRVNSFSWQSFYDRLGGGEFLEALKGKMRAEYDYILIDSRSGVTDTAGICTVQMPDILVLCFTISISSIDSVADVGNSVYHQRSGGQIAMFPVPMRVEQSKQRPLQMMDHLKSKLARFPNTVPLEGREQYWKDVKVNYDPFYANEEVLATFADLPGQRDTILASAERLTGYLTNGEVQQLTPLPELERKAVLAQYGVSEGVSLASTEPTTARQLGVFLCHASDDKEMVRGLYRRLLADGTDPWLDAEKLLPGQKWQEEIPKAVSGCDVVIICLSRRSITKEGYVQKEIRFALDVADEKPPGTIFLIPLKLEECDVPEPVQDLQYVSLFEEGGYARLMKSLNARAVELCIRLHRF